MMIRNDAVKSEDDEITPLSPNIEDNSNQTPRSYHQGASIFSQDIDTSQREGGEKRSHQDFMHGAHDDTEEQHAAHTSSGAAMGSDKRRKVSPGSQEDLNSPLKVNPNYPQMCYYPEHGPSSSSLRGYGPEKNSHYEHHQAGVADPITSQYNRDQEPYHYPNQDPHPHGPHDPYGSYHQPAETSSAAHLEASQATNPSSNVYNRPPPEDAPSSDRIVSPTHPPHSHNPYYYHGSSAYPPPHPDPNMAPAWQHYNPHQYYNYPPPGPNNPYPHHYHHPPPPQGGGQMASSYPPMPPPHPEYHPYPGSSSDHSHDAHSRHHSHPPPPPPPHMYPPHTGYPHHNPYPPPVDNRPPHQHPPPSDHHPTTALLAPINSPHCFSLATEEDKNWLSEFLCFVRLHCIEAFIASQHDVSARLGSKKVKVGQVGIRCRFCANCPDRRKARRSSTFPSSLSRIYQSLTMMLRDHFVNCTSMGSEERESYCLLRKNTSQGIVGSKDYWVTSAKSAGLVDTPDGIFLDSNGRGEGGSRREDA